MLTSFSKKQLYQWDTNQKIILGDEQTSVSHIDFVLGDEVLKVLPLENVITIPDEIFQNAGMYECYLCYIDGTYRRLVFRVIERPKPVDYAYTPTERENFQDLRNAIEEIKRDYVEREVADELYAPAAHTHDLRYSKIGHTHDERYVRDEEYVHTDNNYTDAEKEKLESLSNYDDSDIKAELDKKSDKGHNHDDRYIREHQDISGLATKAELDTKSDKGHNHDERYIREHQDISGLATKTEVDQMMAQKLSKTTADASYAEKTHNHDDRYLREHQSLSGLATKEEVKVIGSKIDDLETFKFPNASIVGEPLIESGNISRFTNHDYLIFPFVVDVRNKPFEINMCFTTGSNVTTQQNVLDSEFGLALAVQNGKGVMAMSSDGSSWDIGLATGVVTIDPIRTYYAKVTWDGSVYKTALSTDGASYVDDMILSSTKGLHPRTVYIGGSPDLFGNAHPFGGVINLNKCSLSIAGLEVWRGMDDAGISSRADVSLSNLDAQGEKRFSDLSDRITELEERPVAKSDAQTIIENHIKATPDYGVYTVRFPKWDTSHTATGEKLDDNQGLVLTPGTDTVKEINTYPHCFDTIDVNAYVDENGVRHITAIKGDENFRYTGRVDVFVCLRTYWEKCWEEGGYEYYSRCYYPKEGYTINSLAKNRDGSYNSWFLIAKYMAGDILDDDSVHTHALYSSKGLRPAHYISSPTGEEEITDSISWSGMQSIFKKRGTFYTGSLMSELKHFTTSIWLYFATKNTQSVMHGYANSSVQYICAEPTIYDNCFVVTASQANMIDLYQCVSVGDNGLTTAPDRNIGACHNIAYDVRVIRKETLESGNVAIYVDHEPFTTTATSWISSFHELSGYSDLILGRNGSPVSNTNGRHGMVLDGIEVMVGGYETVGNAIFNATDNPLVRDVAMTNDATKLSTTVTTFINNAIISPIKATVETNNAWNYATEVGLDLENGAAINTKCGQSGSGSSAGHCDGQYFDAITAGQGEVLSFGGLGTGSYAGLRCVRGNNGVSTAYWNILARLSINAVQG